MKSICVYHPDQYITNFCRDRNCLLPLCPSCICHHSDLHAQHDTNPHYANITEVIADAHTQITNWIYCLQEDKSRNGNLLIQIQTIPDKIRERIAGAKKIVLKTIEESFVELQKQLNAAYEKVHEQNNVYSYLKAVKYDDQLLKHLDELHSLKNGLKGEKGLSNIIYFYKEKQMQFSSFHSQMTSYLHANQSYSFNLDINSDALYSIGAVISRLLKPKAQSNPKLDRSRMERSESMIHNRTSTQRISTNRKNNTYYRQTPISQIPSVSPLKQTKSNYVNQNLSPYRVNSRISPMKAYEDGGEYDNLAKRVMDMREENERLSRYLRGE